MSGDSVFVVDGDPAVRDSLSTLLNLNGFEVDCYSTGAAFLKRLGSGVSMDCVICEAELPDVTGIRIFQQVMELLPGTPFALLVSSRNPQIIQAARQAGIEKIFPKPLVYRQLIEFINAKSQ